MQKKLSTIFGKISGLDEKSVAFLTNALEKKNLPGFDYLEYKLSLEALQAMNMDEETSFKSAYATAATMGLTKDRLLKTADHYRSVLLEEKKHFDTALQKQTTQRVDSKTVEVEKLKKQIKEYQQKIAELQQRIEKAQYTIDNADQIIEQERQKIEHRKNAFEFTHQSIINQINKDIENIQQYL